MEGHASSALPRLMMFISMSNLGNIAFRCSFFPHQANNDRLAGLFLIYKQRKQLKNEDS